MRGKGRVTDELQVSGLQLGSLGVIIWAQTQTREEQIGEER